LGEEQERGRRVSARLEELSGSEARYASLAAQLSERDARVADLEQRLATVAVSAELATQQLHATQVELAASNAALAAQQAIAADLREIIGSTQRGRSERSR
jgi:chromosome segregation ATPase